MNRVVIVDYGFCNLDSVCRAVEQCGGAAVMTDQPQDIEFADRIILPGVGAFPDAIRNLRMKSLDKAMGEQVLGKNIPFLGICLGMQLLASESWEGGESEGLGWIEGKVRRLEPSDGSRLPHVGWNEVMFERESPLFKGIEQNRDFYFVHSYCLWPRNEQDILAYTPYGGNFVSAVQHGLIFGVQFHPEKSQRVGLQVIDNFLAI